MIFRVKQQCLSFLVIVLLLVGVTGCLQSKYDMFRKEYIITYYNLAETIDMKNIPEALNALCTIENKNNIKKLEMLLINIKGQVPKSMEIEYEEFARWHKELISISGVSNWDKLPQAEKERIYVELIGIKSRMSWIKDRII